MEQAFEISATPRTEHGRKKIGVLRKSGAIPAVLYGHGITTQPLSLPALEFSRVFEKAGESTLLKLAVSGQEPVTVLVHDLQRDPLSHQVTHVDFYQVRMDEKITAEVELSFSGQAPAEKELGGILVKNLSHLEIECFPANLPHDLPVDLSVLKTFDDVIRVKDLAIPAGVTVMHEPEDAVVSVSEPRSEEELKALEEAVVENVENVEVAGKKEADEAAAEEAPATGEKS